MLLSMSKEIITCIWRWLIWIWDDHSKDNRIVIVIQASIGHTTCRSLFKTFTTKVHTIITNHPQLVNNKKLNLYMAMAYKIMLALVSVATCATMCKPYVTSLSLNKYALFNMWRKNWQNTTLHLQNLTCQLCPHKTFCFIYFEKNCSSCHLWVWTLTFPSQ